MIAARARLRRLRQALALLLLVAAGAACAWTRPGHMVSAAIAYDRLQVAAPDDLAAVMAILSQHPDRAPFEVAIDRTTGDAQARRRFGECARWADDVRGTALDHPSWHHMLRPVAGEGVAAPPPIVVGEALSAFALNFRTLANSSAPASDRALALCWVMHLVGDIHQPLHTAQLVSTAYPKGDRGGGLQFVREAPGADAVTLHWFWDDAVHRHGDAASVAARAAELEKTAPAPGVAIGPSGPEAAFAAWAAESYALARSLTYSRDLVAGASADTAPVVTATYADTVKRAAAERLHLAGERLAAVLSAAMAAARAQ